MYIRRIEINNIRSIEHFEMAFPNGKEAGWHVLIGDNGAGKSTIIRAVALALLDYADISAARQDWNAWLQTGQRIGSIDIVIAPNSRYDGDERTVQNRVTFEGAVALNEENQIIVTDSQASLLEVIFRSRKVYDKTLSSTATASQPYVTTTIPLPTPSPPIVHYSQSNAWFSVAYGPFRRFVGGSEEKDKLFQTNPQLGAHLSVFGEDVALTEALSFLRTLYIRQIEDRVNERTVDPTLDNLLLFINRAGLLPHQATIDSINIKDGVWFRDGNGYLVQAIQMSDGYRSILSMTFELIRQLIRVYSSDIVFANVRKDNITIDLPGVILIDEVDAHLHPTWQTDIGQWFTKYFPNIQFIVTTHSPLVCRAAEKGTIWYLPAPGSDEKFQEIKGDEKKRLVFGNVLDAYGTNAFGDNVARSESANDKLNELAELNIKSIMGQISPPEEQKLTELRSIFPSEG